MNIQLLIYFAWAFMFSPMLESQNPTEGLSPGELAANQILELKEGHITVVLPSDIKKLNELHQLSQSPDLSEKQRQRFKKRYDRQLTERKEFNKALIRAADTSFHFTEVQFIYDYQLRSEPPNQNYAEAPPFKVKAMEGREFRLRVGKTREVQNFGVKAIILTDSSGKDLMDPFPYYVKLYRDFWNGGFLWINRAKEPVDLMQELDQKLTQYYLEVIND